jgi:hypothetical protein
MNFILFIAAFLFSNIFSAGISANADPESIANGRQPELSIDAKGKVRVVFGRNDSIFCLTWIDKSGSFSKPKFVARVNQMHLGMTRGPQIASSKSASLITAIDKQGNIHCFLLNHVKDSWIEQTMVNDTKSSAPEGLMSLAADKQDNFYAVWLDLRKERRNNIYFSSFSGNSGKWTKNKLVYASPDQHVCECCKPSIAVQGSGIAVMFRNWLNGSRDLYFSKSDNKGIDFTEAIKVGEGTWKLNGCPMDGGGVSIDNSGKVHTAWRREGVVYYARPNEKEIEVGKGKSCSISTNKNKILISLQDGGNTKLVELNTRKEINIGKGSYLKSSVMPDGKIICVWEEDAEIKFKLI